MEKGGLLVRFAGPRLAEHPDALLPVKLLAGDRQLGGAMSWSQPAGLAPFPPGSPFAGLAVPAEVRVTRQVLAEPGAHLTEATWARLADGTPLVTQAARGAGRIVLFHVTANADWSDLPLSGLFVDMLRRLVALSAGVAAGEDADGPPLAPAETLDGFGQLGPPPPAAAALPAPRPRRGAGLAAPSARAVRAGERAAGAQPVQPHGRRRRRRRRSPGAREAPLGGAAPERALGPWLMAARAGAAGGRPAAVAAACAACCARAAGACWRCWRCWRRPAPAQEPEPNPALATRLAYIVTGDAQVDGVSRSGLAGLSDYVNRRTAANLAEPGGGGAGRGRSELLPAALLAGHRRRGAAAGGRGRGAERLHGAWRHHPDRHRATAAAARASTRAPTRRCSGSPAGWRCRRWRR